MADLYVDSNNGAPTSPYDTWGKAAVLMETGLADGACVAGSIVHVAHDHAESTAATQTWASQGTSDNPVIIICENSSTGAYATTAVCEATGGFAGFDLEGVAHVIGVSIKSSDDVNLISTAKWVVENGALWLTSGSGLDTIDVGNGIGSILRLIMSDVRFNSSGQSIQVAEGCRVEWFGGGVTGGTAPDELFVVDIANQGSNVDVRDCDFSAVSIGNLVDAPTLTEDNAPVRVNFESCKIHAATGLIGSGTPTIGSLYRFMSVDIADDYFQVYEQTIEGVVVDATNVKRTGGVTYDGTNGYSIKLVSNSNTMKSYKALCYRLGTIWSPSANPTIRVEVIHDQQGSGSGSDFQNDELYIFMERPNATDQALRTVQGTRMALLGTPADYPNSAATWTEDLANEVKQYLESSVTGPAGEYTVYICLAPGATKTVYACPQIELTAGS